MKYLATLLLLMGISTMASAQLLVREDFNFTGNLTSNNWSAHSGSGTNPISTTTGLTYSGYMGSNVGNAALLKNLGGEDDNLALSDSVYNDGDVLYLSYLVDVTDTSSNKTGDYFIHIGNRASAISFSSFAARFFAKITAGAVNFGLSNTSTPTYGSTAFAKNTTYLVVIKYKINVAGNDTTSFWVFSSGIPATEAAAGTPEVTNSTTAGQNIIDAIALRQGSGTSSPQVVVDGIRVTRTWQNINANLAVVTPRTIDFGKVALGSSATDTVLVMNSDATTINITSASSGDAVFTVAPSTATLLTGESQKFFVTYTPTATVSSSSAIVFTSDAASSPDSVMVSGKGIQAGFSMSPTSLNFGKVWKDSTVIDSVEVINASTTAHLVVDSITSSNPFFSITPLTADLDTSSSLKFAVTFNPTAKGTATADIVFYHNAASKKDTLKTSGIAIVKEPGFLATPSPLDFHGVLVGKSKVDTITVKNDGYDSLFISNVTSTSGSFTVTPTTTRLDSMASTKFVVTFSPATAGLKSGSLVFESNVAETKDTVLVSGNGSTVTTIAEARIDANFDLIPDHSITKDTLFVTGVITSPNVQTAPQSGYFVQDSTAGVIIFSYDAAPVEVAVGDSVVLIGKVAQYRGLTEFTPLKMDTVNFKVLKHNAVLPKPKVITVSQFVTNPETYEGSLIEIDTLYYSSGTWPADGSNGNLFYKEKTGADSVQIFVDKDTQVDGTVQPLDPVNFKGVVSQYSSASTVYNDGYELIPRDTSDIKHVVIDAVAGRVNGIPKEFYLSQNYPNPFNPATTIEFGLPKESHVQIAVYNVLGQRVVLLVDGVMKAGNHRVAFNASRFASGVYFYVMRAGEKVFKQKMLLMK